MSDDNPADDDSDDAGSGLDIYRVNPEGIVDEVKSGWGFLWHNSGDRGKVPKYTDRPWKNAASDDPDTWVPAEEAIDAALERDDYGFGFPCTQAHELIFVDVDTPYGGEWVPTFDRLGGAVIEHSPSGNYRLILRGVEEPEWWKNLQVTGPNKPELKLFTDKGYVSLTGDVIEGHEPPIDETTQIAFEKFLKEAWVNFNRLVKEKNVTEEDGPWNADDDEDSTETTTLYSHSKGEGSSSEHGDDDPEEWMVEADVRDALQHIDPTLHHDGWVRVGFGLGDFFAREDVAGDEETALTLFSEWSSGKLDDDHSAAKWDDAAQEDAPGIISRAYHDEEKEEDPATIGTLITMAKDGGWDMSTCPSAELGRIEHLTGGDSADTPRPEYSPDSPVYEVLDPENGDVELHLVPIDGTSAGVEVTQNGTVEYSEIYDRGFWHNRTIRGRIASEVANKLTGVDQAEVKQGIKDALTEAGIDEREQPDEFEERMQSELVRLLRDRTERVVCHPSADRAEWVITMAPPDESPVTESRTLSFREGDFNDGNAGAFRNAHLAKFFTKVDPDHKEWSDLTDYWLKIQETEDYEADLETDAIASKFADWVGNLQVWDDRKGFLWSARNGYYAEEFYEGEDAVLVPGQLVRDWLEQENVSDDLNLSVELRNRGFMLRPTKEVQIDGTRRSAWPIAADRTPHTAESALRAERSEDEDGDDRPEGLR